MMTDESLSGGGRAVKKILNHAERDVTAIYDRHSYDPEKRTALEAWSRRLEQILNPDSQFPIRMPPRAERLARARRYNRDQRTAS